MMGQQAGKASPRAALVAFAVLAIAVLASRAQTLSDPVLGFDEQYYLLVADRMVHGALPYVDIWDRKPIGLFLIYTLAIIPGGDPFLLYKLLAALFVLATAWTLRQAALRHAGPFGAMVAALLYIFWLNFMEGEGGQAPVFFNLPVLLAAVLVRRAVEQRAALVPTGLAAMLLVGLAIQIKYSCVFEAAFFGAALVWRGWREWGLSSRLGQAALAWAAIGLAPTIAAWGAYAALGHGQDFVFANFLSIFGRLPDPWTQQLLGLLVILAILAPLTLLALLPSARGQRVRFEQIWAGAALVGMLTFGSFLSPNYGLPLLAPLCLCAGPWFDRAKYGRPIAAALLALGLVAGTIAVRQIITGKGTRDQALAVAAAARPLHGGCIWVWDGYPGLYQLTGSCVPTKWAFPGHLNTHDEASVAAIGVDPEVEVRRILGTRPEVIVDDFPAYALGNRQTRALVQAELAANYVLAARIETGKRRFRLVYRRR